MAQIHVLSSESRRELKGLLERERQRPGFRGVGNESLDISAEARHVRLVRVLESSAAPMYRVQVEFGELVFDDTAGGVTTETFEAYSPQVTKYALDRDGTAQAGDITLATMHHARWYLDRQSSSSACNVIQFSVLQQDPSTRSVLAQVVGVPNGCTLADLPEVIGLEVEICDPAGCFFNEPDPELFDRRGWAKYMLPLETSVCQPDENYLVPMWTVFALCPKPPECIV